MTKSDVIEVIGHVEMRWPRQLIDKSSLPIWIHDLESVTKEAAHAAVERIAKGGAEFPPSSGMVYAEAQSPGLTFDDVVALMESGSVLALAYDEKLMKQSRGVFRRRGRPWNVEECEQEWARVIPDVQTRLWVRRHIQEFAHPITEDPRSVMIGQLRRAWDEHRQHVRRGEPLPQPSDLRRLDPQKALP